MTTLSDRPGTALLVIGVQDSLGGMPRDDERRQYVGELTRHDAEPLVHKDFGDALEATDLEESLAGRGVGHLVVTGAQTDMCIRSMIHGAFARGYDVTLVADAHTMEDLTSYGAPALVQVIAHTNLYWNDQAAPGRTASTVTTGEVTFTRGGA